MGNMKYTTVDQQLEKLKAQNLTIHNEDAAKEALHLYGYSNLIKSYRAPYIVREGDIIHYRDGVSFDQIASIYILDKRLRNAVISAMLDLEEHIKAMAADVVASAYGTHESNYLQFRNYRDKRKRKYQFSLNGVLEQMQKALHSEKDPIHHYATEHGIVPPWILFKGIYFSTIINFINLFKPEEQRKLVSELYDNPSSFSEQQLRFLMMDTLFIALNYRNLSAHGGRIYNHDCSNRIRSNEIFGNDYSIPHGFGLLLFLLDLLSYKGPFQSLDEALNREINRHCTLFPEDVTYLGSVLNVNIEHHKIGYIGPRSGIVHSDPYCSGMKKSHPVELDQALKDGFRPCKRCVRSL